MRKRLLPSVFVSALLVGTTCPAAERVKAASLDEVLGVLRSNTPVGMTQTELNDAAVRGLLSALDRKVYIVQTGKQESSAKELLTRTEIFDSSLGYFRVERVASGVDGVIAEAMKGMLKTNKLRGVVIDLRFAQGDDYEAAGNTADLFVAKERPLLGLGGRMKSSSAQSSDFSHPVAVLVNEQTSGASEALAAVLRDAGAGLIFGSRTAGKAAIPRDFTLSNGQVLRIATQAIELGSGAKLSGPVKPDIEIEVTEEDERVYYADAFATLQMTNQISRFEGTNNVAATNRTSRRNRFNEADLVREHSLRSRGEGTPEVERGPETPTVNDPVLARALDVLKGLAVVRQSKS